MRKYIFMLLMLLSVFCYAQGTSRLMPEGEIETVLVGAKRMTIQDILDSVSIHRQPDSNPYRLRTTLLMRLYNDTANYFSFKQEGYLNMSPSHFYAFSVEKETNLFPDINQLVPEQARRSNRFILLPTYEKMASDRYLVKLTDYGKPFYKTDTEGANAQIHLFFFINKSNWYMNTFNHKIKRGDTTEKEIVRFHKLDIDRATWTVRHKEAGALKVTPERKKKWEEAQTYEQYDFLLNEGKQDPATQKVLEATSYAVLGDSFLVPVSMTCTDNFSPVAGAPLLGKPVLNPEGSTFELAISHTELTPKPHNPDPRQMRVVDLEAIFKSPLSKKKK